MQHTPTSTTKTQPPRKLDPRVTTALDVISTCAIECDRCAVACLDMGGMETCAKLCLDTADVCRVTTTTMARGSSAIDTIVRLCIEVATPCAIECERNATHHEPCRRTGEALRKCIEACRQLAM